MPLVKSGRFLILLLGKAPMIVMGIDPGLADLGWGVVELPEGGREPRWLNHGVIRTTPDTPLPRRLKTLHDDLAAVMAEFMPEVAAVEEIFFAANRKTAVAVAQARGVALMSAATRDIEIAEYSPPQIKQALVGYGRASKRQVQLMVKGVLGLDDIPKPDHAADALAAALTHLSSLGLSASIGASVADQLDEAETADPAINVSSEDPNKLLLAQARTKKRRR